MGAYTGVTAGGFVIGADWQVNDSLVNTVSAMAPLGAPSAVFDRERMEPGVWQTVPATGRRVCRVSDGDAANVHEKFQIFRFKNSNICGSIHVRPRKIGDTLRIAGRIGEKTLKKWMIEERIPALERDSWPVFADDLGVVAVPGLGTAERAAAGDGEADGAILLSERNEPCRK